MSNNQELSAQQAQEKKAEMRSNILGLGLALALTLVPFMVVAWADISRVSKWWIIGNCAIVQIIVHFRCFLHITLSKQKREDLHLILFSTLLLVLMVGGTLWIIFNLYSRMSPSMFYSGG